MHLACRPFGTGFDSLRGPGGGKRGEILADPLSTQHVASKWESLRAYRLRPQALVCMGLVQKARILSMAPTQ
jgi:hypothetical protein